jgi:hypothetical protein
MTTRPCDHCGKPYTAQRSTSRYCSDLCRRRHGRAAAGAAEVTLLPGAVTAATRRELVAGGRLESALGQVAMVLAQHIDSTTTATVRSLAALCKAHREVMAEAEKSLPVRSPKGDILDQLRARRDVKRVEPS